MKDAFSAGLFFALSVSVSAKTFAFMKVRTSGEGQRKRFFNVLVLYFTMFHSSMLSNILFRVAVI